MKEIEHSDKVVATVIGINRINPEQLLWLLAQIEEIVNYEISTETIRVRHNRFGEGN